MKHPLQEMMDKRRQGIRCGIPSYCSANELVIEIALRRAKERNIPVLIEATANQVNQFGGYTGMKPADFYQMVLKMARDIDLPENMMILAGDHLGPLTWQKLPEAEAMKKETYKDEETGEVKEWPRRTVGWGDFTIDIYAMTKEEAQALRELINSTDRSAAYDKNVINIVSEELQSFFSGAKSAEDTARLIQDRVGIYVNEQR